MKEELIEILEGFGYPVFLQGSLNSADDYPDSFFTFWNFSTPEELFYSNEPHGAWYGFWVYFYSTNPLKVQTVTEQARQALRAADWTPEGMPNDISVDVPTHTGAFFTVYKLQT